jgi:AcrR family transcriptional regulator
MPTAKTTASSQDPLSATRWQRRRQATEDRIIAAALTLFKEHGYQATSMDMIATEADVARTTVFNHFPRKDALLLVLLADRRRVVGERLASSAQQGLDTTARIRDAVTHWARAYERDSRLGAMLIRAWVHAGGPYLPGSTATADLFTDTLRAGQHTGDIHADIDPGIAGLVLFDATTGTLVRWAAGQPGARSRLAPAMLASVDTALAGMLADTTRLAARRSSGATPQPK